MIRHNVSRYITTIVIPFLDDTELPRQGRTMAKLPNIHPGEVLFEEFLKPMAISQNKIARAIGVPPRRINEIVLGKRAITADTALRLSKYFGGSESLWMGMQADYNLKEARKVLGKKLGWIQRVSHKVSK